MKYGLLVYLETENIGDDVQSYAAERFLPKVDYIVDRDDVTSFCPKEKEHVATIMNAWWLNKKFNWPPSPYIFPKLISMHFTSYDTIYNMAPKHITTGKGKEYLIKHQPIGCRDTSTLKTLTENGIDAYFTGCMTLTLKKFENVEKEDYILLVDVADKVADEIEKTTNKKVIKITNNISKEENMKLSWEQRKENVIKYLMQIQKASLVITQRLHCALPSLALETPVVLVNYSSHNDRTGDFLKLLNVVTEDEILSGKCKYDFNGKIENRKDYMAIREKLEKECYEFIEKTQEQISVEKLPDVDMYKEFSEINNYQKKLLLDSFHDVYEKYRKEEQNAIQAWEISNRGWKLVDELTKTQ